MIEFAEKDISAQVILTWVQGCFRASHSVRAISQSPLDFLREWTGFSEAKDWGREKKKHSKYFWKILWAFLPQNSPYPSSATIPTPVFSPNCGQKSTRKENFFQNFQKLFSSQTLVFCLFQNFFPCKCRPRHTLSRWKSTKNGQPAQPKLPKNYLRLANISISAIPRKKYSKKSKKLQKRGWLFSTGVLYYMSARNESGKNNGPWKLNNKLRERNKDLVNNFEHKVLK